MPLTSVADWSINTESGPSWKTLPPKPGYLTQKLPKSTERVTASLNLEDDSRDASARPGTEGDGGGFLSTEAIQEMLRRLLLLRVGESLRQIHRRMPDKELTPQIEQESVEAVQAYRAERRG